MDILQLTLVLLVVKFACDVLLIVRHVLNACSERRSVVANASESLPIADEKYLSLHADDRRASMQHAWRELAERPIVAFAQQ